MKGIKRRNGRARAWGSAIAAVSLAAGLLAPPAHAATSVASADDVTVVEGDSGTGAAVFTVRLSESNGTTTVGYTTTNGSATAGSDYTATSGTLTFGPGQISKTVSVPVLSDVRDEPDETFFFTLTSIDNGTFQGGDPDAVGTITDDDPSPTISPTDASVPEGNSGTTTTTVSVSLSATSDRHISVDFRTVDGTATFSPGADYHSQSGRLVFAPGDTVETITLTIVSDTTDEADESFFVDLFGPQSATIADPRSVITILDDDTASQPPPPGSVPAISISDASVGEGNSGTVQTNLTVTLSSASSDYVAVDFATQDNTATFSGGDYHSQSGRLVFAPGETSKIITVTVSGDTVDEQDESFFVNLTNATDASIADARGVITILDDDTAGTTPPPPSGSVPSISIGDVSVVEGDEDETRVSVTVSLSSATTNYVSVDFTTADGTAFFSSADYWSSSGRLVFAPGDTSETITATIVGDTFDEPNEVFYIDLSNPTRAAISDPRGAVTILDDDAPTTSPPPTGTPPSVSVSDTLVQEGDDGTTTATLTVSLSEASTEHVSVDLVTVDHTATFADGDYWELAGRIVFAPGVTSQPVQVTVNGDAIAEGNEIFYLDLIGSSSNATIEDPRGLITIVDDDPAESSQTSLTIVKRRYRIVARGQVVPPHPGIRMRVVLKKRRPDGSFRRFDVNRPVLGDALDRDGDGVFESTYRTRLERPKRGRCLVRAVFPGDVDHTRSVAQARFRC